MTKLTKYEIQFFEITNIIKSPITEETRLSLLKLLLKLNNPTYYSKYIVKNPIDRHGFSSTIITNPILQAVIAMINIINSRQYDTMLMDLQKELSWAYIKYPRYAMIDK